MRRHTPRATRVAFAIAIASIVIGTASAVAEDCGPLACTEALVELPYTLDFSSDDGEILDANGVGTGFTYLQPTTHGTGYVPQNLSVNTAAGQLDVTTTAGLAIRTTNTQDNTLGVGIDSASQVTRIETTIDDPPDGTGHNEQAGLWFGNDEDNYVKLVYVSTSAGTRVQFLTEQQGAIAEVIGGPFIDLSGHTLTLSLIADPVNQRIDAFYSVDGGSPVSLSNFVVPGEFFSFDAAQIDPTIGTDTFTGILASHRGGPSPLHYIFNDFSVTKERDATGSPADLLSEGISFERSSFPVTMPTSMVWGPDGRLYVTELLGTIHALTLDDDKQVVDDQVITTIGTRLTLGITVDPASTPSDVILWVANSDPSLTNGAANSSMVSRLSGVSGPGPITKEDVITGLPRAIANHATNSLHFGPDGRLYIAQGGNTGAGAANEISGSEFGDRAEQPLSAALLVADVEDPSFDGSCDNVDIYGPPPCDVETYATGLRNTYDFAFHSNGELYGADNSVGTDSTFPPSPTPPCDGFGDPIRWDQGGDEPDPLPDPLNRLQEGKYYGHPNPTRDECVFYDGRFQGVGPAPNYEPPMYDLGAHRSADGITEYTADDACGSLMGNLLIANYGTGDNLTRVILSSDGTSVVRTDNLIGGFNDPVPVIEGPDGTIYVGEFGGDQVTALQPENIGCWTDRAPQPAELLDAGGATVGGKLYVVGGEADAGHVSSLYVFDPSHNRWTQGPDLPGPAVENPAAVEEGGKLYVFGGATHSFSGAVTNAAVFDPDTNAWTTLADLPSARGQATAAAVGGKIYLAGGLDPDGASLARVDVFDPGAGTWSPAAPMSTRRDDARAVALDGKIYVFGGGTRDADGTWVDRTLDTVEMYDPGSDTWTDRAPMPTGRQSMAVGTLHGRVQLMGGELKPSSPGTFSENEEYDPDTDSWRALASMQTPRHGAAAGTIAGVVYVAGGGTSGLSSFSATNEAFSFDPLPGLAPDAFTGAAGSLTPTAATLNGTVNPSGQQTSYHFEYGTDMGYGSEAPLPDGDAGSGTGDQPVAAAISGLEPDTTYHYRLVASSASGTALGDDASFTTLSANVADQTPPSPRIFGKRIKLSRSGVARVRVRCPAGESDPSCVGRLRLLTAHLVRFGGRRRVLPLGRRDFKIPAGERRRLSVRLRPSMRRLVAERGRLRVMAIATAHDLAGNKGVSRHALTLVAA